LKLRLVRLNAAKVSNSDLLAIREALRWGEPCAQLTSAGTTFWAAPITINNKLLGGLVTQGVSLESGEGASKLKCARAACQALLELVERHNIVNAALMQTARATAREDRERAEALHDLKAHLYDTIREVCLREEAALLAAIKRGERAAARQIVKRVLVGIYHAGSGRMDLLKSFSLELIVMMCRAAVESGAHPGEVLGNHYSQISDLSDIEGEEELAAWLKKMLERLMDAIRDNRQYLNTVLLSRAMAHMEDRLGKNIDRDSVARLAGLSPSQFSHLMREKTGRTFSDLLSQMCVDRARALLARTTKSMVQIAIECGFCDQSHFTRVFKKYCGLTPS
jgi:AraC-like DNA-binding protein